MTERHHHHQHEHNNIFPSPEITHLGLSAAASAHKEARVEALAEDGTIADGTLEAEILLSKIAPSLFLPFLITHLLDDIP